MAATATIERPGVLDALRRGAQDMMQQMQQAMQGDQGGSEEGGRQQNSDRDPLGRSSALMASTRPPLAQPGRCGSVYPNDAERQEMAVP